MSVTIDASERWRAFVDSQVWEKGHRDEPSYLAFLRAGSLGIDPQEALATVAARYSASGAHPPPGKLQQQIRRAYARAGSNHKAPGPHPLNKGSRPVFLPDYARKFAERVPAEINQDWLRWHSPIRVPYLLTPAEFLGGVYEMGDQVLIFTDCRSQGQIVWQRCTFKVERDELSSFVRGHADGVWLLSNPVDGKEHFNERQQKVSRRSEESITAFRYAVLESDCQPLGQWLRILVQLPLPIVSITSSGGKSLHALVRVDANTKTEWDSIVGIIKSRLIYLGADPCALTAVRLTRLPNCYRGNRFQELIYLNPDPSTKSIWGKL